MASEKAMYGKEERTYLQGNGSRTQPKEADAKFKAAISPVETDTSETLV